MRFPIPLAVAPLALSACFYAYDNPAEALRDGQVRGRAVAEREGAVGTFDPLEGASVELKGAGLTVTSRSSGAFVLFGLHPGRHTLLMRRASGTGFLSIQRTVEVGLGRNGQPEGVLLGDVPLLYTAAISGRVVDSSAVGINGAFVVDDVSNDSAWTDASGNFTLTGLAIGPHRLRAYKNDYPGLGATVVGVSANIDLLDSDQRTTKDIGDLEVHAPTGTGELTFRCAPLGEGDWNIEWNSIDVELINQQTGAASLLTPLGSDGGATISPLQEGVYTVHPMVPAAPLALARAFPSFTEEPRAYSVTVVQGAPLDLGTLYFSDPLAVEQSRQWCESDKDCDVSYGKCVNHACTFGQPGQPF